MVFSSVAAMPTRQSRGIAPGQFGLLCLVCTWCNPLIGNYKGFPACQVKRIQNESRQRFKRLAVSRIKTHRVVLAAR